MLKKLVKILQIIGIVVVCVLLVLSIIQKVLPQNKLLFGYRTFVIVSKSMEPKLKVGDVILIKHAEPEDLKVSDIISYMGSSGEFQGKIITHRIKAIQTEDDRYIFITKGDSNDLEDPAVYTENIYGKVIYKSIFLSIISKILRNTVGFIILVVAPLILLFVKEIKDLRSEIKERRN